MLDRLLSLLLRGIGQAGQRVRCSEVMTPWVIFNILLSRPKPIWS